MDVYKKYDTSKGYGNPQEWVSAFFERLGIDQALEVLGEDEPLTVLGLKADATWEQVNQAYRELALKWHPDRNHDDNAKTMMKRINAAYEVLEARYGK